MQRDEEMNRIKIHDVKTQTKIFKKNKNSLPYLKK